MLKEIWDLDNWAYHYCVPFVRWIALTPLSLNHCWTYSPKIIPNNSPVKIIRASPAESEFQLGHYTKLFPNAGRVGAKKINANFFRTKLFKNPSGHGRPRQKSWTSAPKSAFFCGPGDGEKLFDPGSSGRKGQECPREIRTKKFMFMLFFLPWQGNGNDLLNNFKLGISHGCHARHCKQ